MKDQISHGYVFSKELGEENGINFSFEIYREPNGKFRPILTANDEEGTGFSVRRELDTVEEAMRFYTEDLEAIKREAVDAME